MENIEITESMRKWFKDKFNNEWEKIDTDIDFSKHIPIEETSSLHVIQDTYIIDDKKYRLSYPISDSTTKPTIEILIK